MKTCKKEKINLFEIKNLILNKYCRAENFPENAVQIKKRT